MKVISENDSKLLQQLEEAREDVELKKRLQEQARQFLEEKLEEREESLNQIKTSRAQVEGEISRTKKEIAALEKEIDKQLEESKRLEGVIKNLLTKQKYVGGTMTWPCPSSYTITSAFGNRKHPILRKYKMHTGIDIGASKGASIVAANSGTVIMAYYDKKGYGNVVVIDHGGGISTCMRIAARYWSGGCQGQGRTEYSEGRKHRLSRGTTCILKSGSTVSQGSDEGYRARRSNEQDRSRQNRSKGQTDQAEIDAMAKQIR